MSQENVEVVRQIFEAVNRGDFEGALAVANPPPEFEFVPSGVLIPDLSDVQRGPEGLRRVQEMFLAAFAHIQVEVHELIDAGDRVFGSYTIRGRGTHSAAETSWDVWNVWIVRDSRVVRWLGFTDPDDALEAAGLRNRWTSWENDQGSVKDGDYTLVENREAGPRGLAVRQVSEAERRMVWRWGGFLFSTAEDAERFARRQLVFEDGPQVARQAFSHRRVDGRRIYVHLGSA